MKRYIFLLFTLLLFGCATGSTVKQRALLGEYILIDRSGYETGFKDEYGFFDSKMLLLAEVSQSENGLIFEIHEPSERKVRCELDVSEAGVYTGSYIDEEQAAEITFELTPGDSGLQINATAKDKDVFFKLWETSFEVYKNRQQGVAAIETVIRNTIMPEATGNLSFSLEEFYDFHNERFEKGQYLVVADENYPGYSRLPVENFQELAGQRINLPVILFMFSPRYLVFGQTDIGYSNGPFGEFYGIYKNDNFVLHYVIHADRKTADGMAMDQLENRDLVITKSYMTYEPGTSEADVLDNLSREDALDFISSHPGIRSIWIECSFAD